MSRFQESLEPRQLFSLPPAPVAPTPPTYDGTGNNLANPRWGAADTAYRRLAKAAYSDGKSALVGGPSARAISNAVSAHGTDEIPNDRKLSAYLYAWGQFIDHDLDLTDSATPAELASIPVPAGDPWFDPANTGTQTIPLTRSEYVTDANGGGVRQQVNSISAYIDASMVYGSSKDVADKLRTLTGGRLKTSEGGLLPYNTLGVPMATLGGPDSAWFAAGDVRANENVELLALQTLFVREHNRLAAQISARTPTLTDEQIYQQARKLVSAIIQSITYNEFLPALLGPANLPAYRGYNPNVNATISNEFATAAFRFGHSLLPDDVEFIDNLGNDVRDEVTLAQAFFNPALFASTGPDPLLKYLASSNAEEVDTKVVDSLRNFLFGPPGAGGLDLVSLNIQRGRDHGLADFNTTRAALGLPRLTSFSQLTSDPLLAASLQSTYGSIDKLDLWVGGLAENHLPGASLGPTFARILSDQFSRTRDGDRFFYLRTLSPAELSLVQSSSLSNVIKRNTTITNLQPNAFVYNTTITGRLVADLNRDKIPQPAEPGLPNLRLNLLDADGNILATTTSRRDGTYAFSSVPIGKVTVQIAPPPNAPPPPTGTPAPSRTLQVTQSMTFNRIDFPLPPPPAPAVASKPSAAPSGFGSTPLSSPKLFTSAPDILS